MPRPILLGIVGDSAAGKTTLTRGLVRILGEQQVTHISADHYHRYDRKQRAEHGLTALDPECDYVDILEQHLAHLRAGEPILKPAYRHQDGTFAAAEYVRPAQFTIVEGLLGFHTAPMRETYDIRIFLDPPEALRHTWKVQRDCSRRGYTTDQVLEELSPLLYQLMTARAAVAVGADNARRPARLSDRPSSLSASSMDRRARDARHRGRSR